MEARSCPLLPRRSIKLIAAAIVLACLGLLAAHADDQGPPPEKLSFSGELDAGFMYDCLDVADKDRPTELKLGSTLTDGNVGFNARLLAFAPTVDTALTPSGTPLSLDYAYGTYLLYWTAFDQFMTAKVSVGDFANMTDYVLSYNSNGFNLWLQGNPIGGYIEGLTGGEIAISPMKTLTIAAFMPWDSSGDAKAMNDTIGKSDLNVSFSIPKALRINAGYGNSYNGDISGSLIQPKSGVNLAYLNVTLISVKNLTLGAEYGNYTNVSSDSSVENYVSGTANYTIPYEESGDSLNFSDDFFCFIPQSGTSVVQEYFSVNYTFSQLFSAADLVLDMDVNYANNYPQMDSTNANLLVASDRNITFNPWVKLILGVKGHILALGYAYNDDLDTAKTGFSEILLNATIYY